MTNWHKITDRNWGFVNRLRPHHFFWGLYIILALWFILAMSGCKENGTTESQPASYTPWSTYPERPWSCITPAGINIITDYSTIEQYDTLWSGEFRWDDIDWETLDEEFRLRKQYYCHTKNWNCKDVTPSQLTLYIKSWDGACNNVGTPDQPRRIYAYVNGYNHCINGWYWGQVIYFHLGNDPGQDHTTSWEDGFTPVKYGAFQESPYPHELYHFFQGMSGLPFGEEDDYSPPITTGWIIILPHEKVDSEDGGNNEE